MTAIKERLYRRILERELKDKYEEGRNNQYGISCSKCGKIAIIEEGILIQGHYRRCPTAQIERVLAI